MSAFLPERIPSNAMSGDALALTGYQIRLMLPRVPAKCAYKADPT